MKLIPKINGSLEMGNGTLQLSPEIRLPRQYPEIDQVFDQRLTALELPPAQGKPTQVVVHTEAMGNGAYRLKIGEDRGHLRRREKSCSPGPGNGGGGGAGVRV